MLKVSLNELLVLMDAAIGSTHITDRRDAPLWRFTEDQRLEVVNAIMRRMAEVNVTVESGAAAGASE